MNTNGKEVELLVVDDSESDRELIKRMINTDFERDIQLMFEESGNGAVTFFDTRHESGEVVEPGVDLVLLDIQLPDINGFDVLSYVRQQLKDLYTVIVMYSGYRNKEHIRRSYELGANSYVKKPQDREDFHQRFQVFLNYWLKTALLP